MNAAEFRLEVALSTVRLDQETKDSIRRSFKIAGEREQQREFTYPAELDPRD